MLSKFGKLDGWYSIFQIFDLCCITLLYIVDSENRSLGQLKLQIIPTNPVLQFFSKKQPQSSPIASPSVRTPVAKKERISDPFYNYLQEGMVKSSNHTSFEYP
jgi:hypothetical protein